MRGRRVKIVVFFGIVFGTTSQADAQTTKTRDPVAALSDGLRPMVIESSQSTSHWSVEERMRHYNVPGVAIAIVKDGKVVRTIGYGVREAGTRHKVDGDTLFSVGSISKVVTAATTLRMVAGGQLDLDRNVADYLKRWKLPATSTLPRPNVSLRMLMSHTAGFGVHGFADYQPDEPVPTLVQVLDGVKPAKNEPVRFKHAPGLLNDYSGGGITVEQMVIEDVAGRPLAHIAKADVFGPLAMGRSTFKSPLSSAHGNIARAHGADGVPRALPQGWENFAEAGASGLWTSAGDLGRFVGGLIESYQGRSNFLPQPLATAMLTEVSPSVFGLGPRLAGSGMGRHFFHMGANESYLSFLEGYPETGDGFAILTNGGGAAPLIAEIRNALADAIGQNGHPAVRAAPTRLPPPTDIAGRYRLDPAVPMDLRRALTDSFEHDAFTIDVTGKDVRVTASERSDRLIQIGPLQFAQTGLYVFLLDFRRGTSGHIRGVTVSLPEASAVAYYVKD